MKRMRGDFVSSSILRSLAKLQNGLNEIVDPNWLQVRSLDDWALAITMESAELMDSYPWKWWKNIKSSVDIQNVKIELTDIFHFALSGDMQLHSEEKLQEDIVGKPLRSLCCFCYPPGKRGTSMEKETKEGIGAVDNLLDIMFFPLTDTDNAVATFRNIIQLANAYRFDLVTEAIIAAARDLGFNLVAYYVAKHTLNNIRQMQGYKNGTYVKVRDGVEDNVLLHECVASFSMDEVLNEETYLDAWDSIMHRVFDAFGTPKAEQFGIDYWLKSTTREN